MKKHIGSEKTEFGEILEEILTQECLPKKDLALKINLSPSQLSQYISGHRRPSLQTAQNIVQALNLDDIRKEKLLSTTGILDKLPTHILGGITQVHPGFPAEIFDSWIGKAKHIIQIQETWIAGSPSAVFTRGIHTLIKQQKQTSNKVPIQVLLLDYSEEIALRRGRDIQLVDEKTASRNIIANLWDFDTLRSNLNIEVKLYKGLPSFATYRCDNQALVGFYTHGNVSDRLPHLQINVQDTLLGQMIERDFDTLWESAREVKWDRDPNITQGRQLLNTSPKSSSSNTEYALK